ncbi:flavin reductase family protein [Pasteuria penetrans]|uniref:flavin reductase family protein n=1 Tax=Pasteuria penetrans TaxID=86005 RepID=UPI000F965A03|nr:flavin reductase family protein [Pasteuria penetrans]
MEGGYNGDAMSVYSLGRNEGRLVQYIDLDPSEQTRAENYRLLIGCVVPRPIAWVSSQNDRGIINVAPFSFFNAIASYPPMIIVSCGRRPDGGRKDTANNLLSQGEFVVHTVDTQNVDVMNETAVEFPADQSEAKAFNLSMVPSKVVRVPRIATAKIQMECRLQQSLPIDGEDAKPQADLFIGEIVQFHIQSGIYREGKIDVGALDPVGRLSGTNYVSGGGTFSLPRPSYEEWKKSRA